MIYFAYGSNCSRDRMTKRKTDFSIRSQGILKDHKLVFNKKATASKIVNANDSYFPKLAVPHSVELDKKTGFVLKSINKRAMFKEASEGYGNIVPSKGDVVYGALYAIEQEGVQELDKAEGVSSKNYTRETIKVETKEGIEVEAIVYIAHPDKVDDSLKPSDTYLAHILGGKDLMPTEYFKKLSETPVLKSKPKTNANTNTNTTNRGTYHNNGNINHHTHIPATSRGTNLHTMMENGVKKKWQQLPSGLWGWKVI